ncbi:hypothetical protein LguiA_010934 [Lonicera macranthoides]
MERESMKEELIIQSSSSMVDEALLMDDSSSSVTTLAVLSSLVAIVGSFTYGFATAYSSPAQSGIMEDLGLSIAEGVWLLDIGRLSLGFGVGLHCYVAPVYIGEITPKSIRGACTVANQAKIGQKKKFEATLQRLRGKNADISGEVSEIKAYMEDLQALPKSRFMDLFEKKHARLLMIVVGLTILVQFGGAYGIASYTSSIFEAAGCPPIIGTTALAIIQISAAGTCLGNFLVGFAFFLQDLHQMKTLTAVLVLCGILIFSSSFSVGMSGTQWIIMSEILPIRVKGAAGSLVTFVNWSSSWIVTYSFNFAFEWSSTGTFFFFAIVSGSIVVFIGKLLPETKGRSLEEIQARI